MAFQYYYCRHANCPVLIEDSNGYCQQHKPLYGLQHRVSTNRPSAGKRGYNAKWAKARATYLRNHPLCAMCGVPANVVDHVVPHDGSTETFWNISNWQPLCHSCHSKKTYSENRRKPVATSYDYT